MRTFHKIAGLHDGETPPDDWNPILYYVDMKNVITAVYTDIDRLEQHNRENKQMVLFL